MKELVKEKLLEDYIKEVDYDYLNNEYVPSKEALEFLAFIKLVNGDKPESHKTPVMHLMMIEDLIHHDNVLEVVFRGGSKALSLNTQIPTPKGNVRLGDLTVGDMVYSRTGKSTVITHESEIFHKPMYKITLEDGRELLVSEDHINIVHKRHNGGWKEWNLTTNELLAKGVTYKRTVSYRSPKGYESKWYIPTAKAIELPAIECPIDPYTVGAILGDGSIDKKVGFTRMHSHVNDLPHWLNTLEGSTPDNVYHDKRNPNTVSFGLRGIGKRVKQFIGTANVYGKRVPQELLWGSIEQRKEVLKGLLDTDGTVGTSGYALFTTVSEGLANDVAWLVRSLGGEVKFSKTNGKHYVLSIRTDFNPFKLKRKADKWKPCLYGRVAIKSIEPIPLEPSKCIAVSDETHSFLAEDFIVTHNTTVLHEYVFLYIATFGTWFGFGDVCVAIYVSDTMENGVQSMREQLEFRWTESEFLQKYVPFAKFTEQNWRFRNAEGHKLYVRGFGASPLALTELVYTKEGTKPISDIQIGEQVYSSDGSLATVKDKSVVFNKPMYKITLKDGRSIKVSEDHLNVVVVKPSAGKQNYTKKVLTTEDLLNLPLKFYKQRGTKVGVEDALYVPMCKPIQFESKNLPVDPYTLGLLLGDGNSRPDGSNKLTGSLNDLDFYITQIPYELGNVYIDKRNTTVGELPIKGITTAMRSLKVQGVKTYDKFIPTMYKLSSIEQRIALLQGLLDTDGTINSTNKSSRVSFSNTSKQLIDDVKEIVESLGGYTSLKTVEAGETRFKDRISKTHKAYVLSIFININLFRLPRKANKFKVNKIYDKLAISSIEKIQDEPSQCILLDDNSNHEFVTTNYFVTHNTGVRGFKRYGTRPQWAGLDDLLSDKNARSPTIVEDIEKVIYYAVENALDPDKKKVVWTGTPFNKKDPLYKGASSGAYKTRVFPVCEQFPCSKEEFKGAWEDRFSYENLMKTYEKLRKANQLKAFYQELMLRVTSEEERLITNDDICWYSRKSLLVNKDSYNFYITTDFATSEKQHADFSVISVWALNNKGYWFLVDGVCRRQTMDKNINDLFRLAQKYQPMSVGVEVSGQQGGFIPWIRNEMVQRNIWFNLANHIGTSSVGIKPNTKKLTRFQTVVPWFKAHTMYLPEEWKTSHELVVELLDELEFVTDSGFRSAHDDAVDTVSMLACMDTWRPSQTVPVKVKQQGSTLWDDDDDFDSYNDTYDSLEGYIV